MVPNSEVGDAPTDSAENSLPANPAEWLASLGATGDEAAGDAGEDG